MNELDILKDVSVKLSKAGINFMLSGSLAMSYYAQPRMTRDIDIVIELIPLSVSKFCDLFQEEYLVSVEAIKEALDRQTMFNIIHNEAIVKVDFIIRKNTRYRVNEFARRKRVKIGEFDTYIVSLEDLIISKLSWFKDSDSELQKRDVKNLLKCQYDREYINFWTNELALYKTFEEVVGE